MTVRYHIPCYGLLSNRFETDINTRMPREEAGEIFGEIRSIGKHSHWVVADIPFGCDVSPALSLDPKLFVEIMGSYRRSVLHHDSCAANVSSTHRAEANQHAETSMS